MIKPRFPQLIQVYMQSVSWILWMPLFNNYFVYSPDFSSCVCTLILWKMYPSIVRLSTAELTRRGSKENLIIFSFLPLSLLSVHTDDTSRLWQWYKTKWLDISFLSLWSYRVLHIEKDIYFTIQTNYTTIHRYTSL
jgi:hypothetical protein